MSEADIRVLIADDEKAIREALADLVGATEGMVVVGVAADADEAIAAATRLQPDVALVDVRMPGGGHAATRGITIGSPGTRVLALSASGGSDTVLEMFRAGAAGYLVKGILPAEVLAGIRHAASGQTPISADAASSVVDRIRGQLAAEDRDALDRQNLVDQLGSALDGDGLKMVFQPIFDLGTKTLVGVESLARFSIEPARPPNEWFDAAAAVGLGVRLEVAAAAAALSQIRSLPAGMFMTVNFSPTALMSPEVQAVIPADVAERVVVELTERVPILDYAGLGVAISPMRATGVSIAIDDAGSGYTSLRHLLELAPKYIKLDIGITQRLEHDRAASALAAALTAFAAEIDAVIVAEGIETHAHLEAARGLGIGLGQGYFLGRPGPLAALG